MGIRGLTSYINGKREFVEPYELHGGYVVIDALSLIFDVYFKSRCNCAFGGDHDDYARAFSDFFDDLEKCTVTPLVIFDGGRERRKSKTILQRMREKLETAKNYSPSSEEEFVAIELVYSAMDILLKKSIKKCYAVWDANTEIAGIAKVLNCPVLSNNSDFYVYGVPYISIKTLEGFVVEKNDVYVKRCKVYKTDNLLQGFPGLDPTVLPLIAVLLGNDYTEDNLFQALFESLGMQRQGAKKKIHTILHWLKNFNLNDAVATILNILPEKCRRRALGMIELVVNGYINTSCELLLPLGFEDLYHNYVSKEQCNKPFKFLDNYGILPSAQLWPQKAAVASKNSNSDGGTKEENCEQDLFWLENNSTTKIKETWPSWFFQRYSEGEFLNDFVGMIESREYAVWARIEDFNYPCPSAISFGIWQVIDGLLMSGRPKDLPGLSFYARDGNDYATHQVDKVLQGTQSVKFPSLAQLQDTQMDIKRRIIDDCLGLTGKESLFQDLPSKWKLYVATIFYWMSSCEEPPRNSCHMYAILLAMLIGIIDQKIGYHRSEYSFNSSFGPKIKEILSNRRISKSENHENAEIQPNSIIEAIDSVTENDCLVAAPFFISQRLTPEILVQFPHKFNVTIVHVFTQFQSCFAATIQLNSLLGYPYERPNISEFFNGTMLYNLYSIFENSSDVETYIFMTLENSPNLSNLMKLLIKKMKSILGDVVEKNRKNL